MIYAFARYSDADHTLVHGTGANGNTETVPANHTLFRQPDDGPLGFIANGGVIQPWIEPEPPAAASQSITKRQTNAALILSGITEPDAFIEGAIATIADPTAKALGLNDWRNAPYYVRSHPLFNDPAMLAAIGMGEQEIDGLWALALTLPK